MLRNELYKIWDSNYKLQIMDIGACEGLSSLEYLDWFPNARVLMFEPRADNCEKIRKNFANYNSEKASLLQFALGNKSGKTDFYVSYNADDPKDEKNIGNKSSSILKPSRHLVDHPWCKFRKETVEIERLDHFDCKSDFIHIDVQGAELDVLEGGRVTLGRTTAVWMEVSKNMLYAGQPLKDKVQRYMRRSGFEKRIDTCTGNYKWGDQLWVRS